MAGDPLEQGVGDDQVEGLAGGPGGRVGGGEVEQVGSVGGGLLQHLRGVVVAGDPGLRPALGEQGGDVACAAAEVGDPRRVALDAGEEIGERACAVVRVPEILLGVPGG